jgi:hypothetical protein
MKTMKLYFDDLKPEVQKEYLKFVDASDEGDLNWQLCPLTILEIDEKEKELI